MNKSKLTLYMKKINNQLKIFLLFYIIFLYGCIDSYPIPDDLIVSYSSSFFGQVNTISLYEDGTLIEKKSFPFKSCMKTKISENEIKEIKQIILDSGIYKIRKVWNDRGLICEGGTYISVNIDRKKRRIAFPCTNKEEKRQRYEKAFTMIPDFYNYGSDFKPCDPNLKPEVTISTNSDIYTQGEDIEIKIRNGLNQSIFHLGHGYRNWNIEYFKNNEWKKFGYDDLDGFQIANQKVGEICTITYFERNPPYELESQWNEKSTWNQRICPFEAKVVRNIGSGKYRLTFNYGFEIDENDPLRIKEINTIYSNNFTIKSNDIGEWKFMEKIKSINENNLPVLTTYYKKNFSNYKEAEMQVDIYTYKNQKLVKEEIEKRSTWKTCHLKKEQETNLEILDCFPGGIFWVSDNFLINIHDSPRIPGIYMLAYDLVLCDQYDCSTVYVSKEIFNRYIKEYPSN